MAGSPVRFLASSWPWRATGYLLTSWLVATVWVAAVCVLLFVPVLALAVLVAGIPLAAVERWRLRLLDPAPARSPHAPPGGRGLWAWLGTRLRESATWWELGFGFLFALVLAWFDAAVGLLVLSVLFLLAFPALVALLPEYQPEAVLGIVVAEFPEALLGPAIGIVVFPVIAYLVTAYAGARTTLTRRLLVPTQSSTAAVVELTRSRERIMQAMDAQRRRIERDLHDGAQQRLIGLIMTLGLARLELTCAPPAGRELVETAYAQARTTLAELRDLVHGIHPQVLTDRGLAPAVAELADRCSIPVEVTIDLTDRPPEPVEAAAWFVISEALTNIAKHSRARQASIDVSRSNDVLVVDVRDDGVGGADPSRGRGLLGLADRVSVHGGRITLSSPVGGPTQLHVEVPCGS